MLSLTDKALLYGAKIVDKQGTVYRVTDATASPDRSYSVVLSVAPVQKQLESKPVVDRLFKYIFSALTDYDLINHKTSVGRARSLVSMIVAGAAEDVLAPNKNANPDPRPE